MPDAINFFSQGVRFKIKNTRKVSLWIKRAIVKEKGSLGEINYIFCSDSILLKINQQFLNHDTLTDIITFDNREEKGPLEADIFISIPRIRENALKLGEPFERELHRVLIHGVLHLLGYSDKSKLKKARMRKKEDAYLSLYK